jgi:hypothetical protein
MSCDFSALANLDSGDPEQALELLHACSTDPQLWLWGLVATVVCAAVGALIGKYKNAVLRDAVLGAALGPIGWIVSLCLPKEKPPLKCPACQRVVERKDAHCRHCGAGLRT